MKFVQEAVLKNSEGSGCRKDGKRVTISAVGMLKPAGTYGRCSGIAIWSDSPYLRMSTGATHLHGDRPAYLSACKRLTGFRPSAQLININMDKETKSVERVIGLDAHPDSFTAAAIRGPTPAAAIVEKVFNKLPLSQLTRWAKK